MEKVHMNLYKIIILLEMRIMIRQIQPTKRISGVDVLHRNFNIREVCKLQWCYGLGLKARSIL